MSHPWFSFCIVALVAYLCCPVVRSVVQPHLDFFRSQLSLSVPPEKHYAITSVNLNNDAFTIPVAVQGLSATALIDTGSAVSMISDRLWTRLPSRPPLLTAGLPFLRSVTGTSVTVLGKASLAVTLSGRSFQYPFFVTKMEPEFIVGLDFLSQQQCCLNPHNRTLEFPCSSPNLADSAALPPICRVQLTESVCVRPLSQVIVPVMPACSTSCPDGVCVLEPLPHLHDRFDVSAANTLVTVTGPSPLAFRFINTRTTPLTLQKGTHVGSLSKCDIVPDSPPDPPVAVCSVSASLPNPVASLFDLSHLSPAEHSAVTSLLEEYECCISRDSADVGHTSVTRHHIDTGSSPPIRQAPRRLPVHQAAEVRHHIDQLLENGTVTPSSSPWAAPIVVVRKPDNSIRLCVDYRKLNSVTRKDAFPLPRVDDAIDHMQGATFFSTLDLASGYWQVELDNASKATAAFTTPFGLYEWNVMPFGLCNAPATFQRLMTTVLHGLIPDTCLDYLDDVIVYGCTFDEQLHRLRLVFARLKSAGLKVRPAKCRLIRTSVTYLGHVFTAAGVTPNPDKTVAVRNWPVPSTPSKVRQFLGFASYYRRFIKEFAAVAKPLTLLTQKSVSFEWSPAAQSAFESLKLSLLSPPVLAYPDQSREFLLDTDASDVAIGAVLSQKDVQGREVVIAYGSSTLSKSQRNYTATNRECYAVVYFCEAYRHYLLGKRFTLRTDHAALVWLSSFKSPDGMMARWIERLSVFDYCVVHRPGRQHINADTMSRLPELSVAEATSLPCAQTAVETAPSTMRLAQEADVDIATAVKWLQTAIPARGDRSLQAASPDLLSLWQQHDRLAVENGTLVRRYITDDNNTLYQAVVPVVLRNDIIRSLHNDATSGHLGITKSTAKARQRFYWPGMTAAIEAWIRACPICQQRLGPVPKPVAPLQSMQSSFPLQRVAMDILGPLPTTARNNSYILVIGDYFTKWVEAFPMPDMTAATVARYFVDGFVCRYGVPLQLHTDQGPQFESQLMKAVCLLLDITKTRTTAYHPQSDGMIERFNRTLEKLLSSCVEDHSQWDLHLQRTLLAYRSSVHASTSYSPSHLMFGRELQLPVDIMYGAPPGRPTSNHPQYVLDLQQSLEKAFARARHTTQTALKRQKTVYDGSIRRSTQFQPGDAVFLFSPVVPVGKSRKLHRYWSGPHRIDTVIDNITAQITDLATQKRQVVHVNRLKPYVRLPSPQPPPRQYNPVMPDTPAPGLLPPAQQHGYNLRPRHTIQPPQRYGS